MPKVRSRSGKYSEKASQAGSDYVAGVENPRAPWAASTAAAAPNYVSGIQSSIAAKRFEKGVAKAGDAKWREKAVTKGGRNYPTAVQEAQQAYDTGFAPFASVIESTTLPPRFPKGDPRNIDRVKKMAEALRNKKVSG